MTQTPRTFFITSESFALAVYCNLMPSESTNYIPSWWWWWGLPSHLKMKFVAKLVQPNHEQWTFHSAAKIKKKVPNSGIFATRAVIRAQRTFTLELRKTNSFNPWGRYNHPTIFNTCTIFQILPHSVLRFGLVFHRTRTMCQRRKPFSKPRNNMTAYVLRA